MSRTIKVATVAVYMNQECVETQLLVDRAAALVEEAGEKWKPDVMVLPELFDVVTYPRERWSEISGEEIPGNGPIQTRFSALARKYGMYLCFAMLEACGDKLYNTAVLVDRNGEFVGKYRKTHLCPSEDEYITPGDEYPVFETDFGKVGITICMDIHSPELHRILALEGAEIILHPTMWYDYTGNYNEVLVNARAIDNGVYFVTADYIKMPFLVGDWMGHARIVDPYGRTRADTSHRPGIAVAEIDLDENYESWYTGWLKTEYPTMKDAYMKLRRPETYGVLTRPDSENKWQNENYKLYRPSNGEKKPY